MRPRGAWLLLAVSLGGCDAPPPARFPGANVVLVGIDTLRADHLGCYGYSRPTSPRIDALASEGVVFTTAVASAPWTLPSFASILTGLLPSHHRAGEGTPPYVSALDATHDTLGTVLQRAGYRTASFVSNVWVGRDVGLDRGFDVHAFDPAPSATMDRALVWLSEHSAEPFFLFVHLFDPHAPYTPPPEHARLFSAPGYEGPFRTAFPTVWANGAPVMKVDPTWSAADRARIVDLYDGEIHYADSLVGRLLDTLRALGVTERTIVIVVSDHGEEFFDHGQLGHSHTLYDELLLVPLVIRFPSAQHRGRVTRQVRSMDIFPTILDALGRPLPPGLDATSLMPLVVRHDDGAAPAPAFAEFPSQGPDPGAKALRLPREKIIAFPVTGITSYFDLVHDPGEHRNVAIQHEERVRALSAVLDDELLAPMAGYHLFAFGREAHDLHVRLDCADGFLDAAVVDADAGDRASVAPDGRSLDVDLRLRPHPGPIQAQYLDGVRFRTRGDAAVTVATATLDGEPLALEKIGKPRVVPYAGVPRELRNADFALSFQLVRRHEARPADLGADAVSRLRALGYVQ